MHRYYTIPAAGALIFIVYKLYSAGYFSYNRFTCYLYRIKNNLINSIDDLKKIMHTDYENYEIEPYDPTCLSSKEKDGRTPLMNYLIEQEAILAQLRSTIIELEKKLSDIDNYYTYHIAFIEHEVILEETQTRIKNMVKHHHDALYVRDNFGKSITQYCQTQQIYHDLITHGAPFEISSWLYFNKNYLSNDTKGLILMTLILSIIPTTLFIQESPLKPQLKINF